METQRSFPRLLDKRVKSGNNDSRQVPPISRENTMSAIMTLNEVQSKLREVITQLAKGDEIAITDGDQVVARIVGERHLERQRPGPGLGKGMITIIADDEEHLKHFAEYMP